jgi:hypothetical protein
MFRPTIDRCRQFLNASFRRNRRPARPTNSLAEVLETRQLLAATGLQAFHRSGQTFITWTEDSTVSGEGYHVYRSASPINTANLDSAEKLTSQWGALDDNTSVHQKAAPGTGVPANFVIEDLGAPVPSTKGLFVYTTPAGQSGTWYYAVTQVTNGTELKTIAAGSNALNAGVAETVAVPKPVLTVASPTGKGLIYTQYMDYAKWNPTFQGYAYNYSVALPDNYDPNVAWPVKLMPHAYGERFHMEPSAEYNWPLIEVFLDDSGGGAPGSTYQTWWYGFAADHNYKTDGPIPTAGRVENFTEQRVLKAIDEVSAMFNVDPLRIHSQGHSMGASGSLSLGMRYANVFSGIFASEPMTNYASSPGFQDDFSVLWGTQASNLSVVNNGPYAASLKKYDGLGVYNWMNHHEQLVNRRGDPMAYLMVGHGKADDVIDWATQGKPFIAALNAGNVGFTAEQRYGWDHNWMSFDFAHDAMFSPTDGGLSAWAYPRNVSFPGITMATGSGPEVPGTTGTNFYNIQFEWSVPWNNFHTNIVDTSTTYAITVKSTTVAQTATITPQRVQNFKPAAGTTLNWQNVSNATGAVVQSGTVVVDADGLITLPLISIGTGTGNRLQISTTAPPISGPTLPAFTAPATTTTSQKPKISWTGTDNTVSYELYLRNLSTGKNPVLNVIVTSLSYTPTVNLGIGKYRMWVRSRFADGTISGWSTRRDFQINTAPVIDTMAATITTPKPLISWKTVPGAVKYDLQINNATTGQTAVFVKKGILTTNSQVTSGLGIGDYKVYVRGVDAAGTVGKWSSARLVKVLSPVLLDSPGTPSFNAQPTLTWNALPGAARYELFLRNKANNVTVANPKDLTGTSWTPDSPLPITDYRWWVRAYAGTTLVTAWSASSDFNTNGRPILLTAAGTTTSRTPTFTWTAVEGAATYQLWLALADSDVKILNPQNLTTTSYTPPTDLAPQSYRVWIRSISTTGVVGAWSFYIVITVTDLDESPAEEPEQSALGSLQLLPKPLTKKAVLQKSEEVVIADYDAFAPTPIVPEQTEKHTASQQHLDEVMIEWATTG